VNHGGNVWEGNHPEIWLDFSANLRPEGTPKWAMAAMVDALKSVHYYPDRPMKRAREGLAAYAGVPSDFILPTAGGAAAIDLVLQRSSGCVYTLQSTFGEYAQRAATHGRMHAICFGLSPNYLRLAVKTEEENERLTHELEDMETVDLIVLPGTKNTIEDLIDLRNRGIDAAIIHHARKGGMVIGVCGGYQMLGRVLHDPDHVESRVPHLAGLDLLDMEVTFFREKHTAQAGQHSAAIFSK